MNMISSNRISGDIKNISDCVTVIMTAEKFLSEYIDKIDAGEDVNTFIFDGLCKTVSVSAESMSKSLDNMRRILN